MNITSTISRTLAGLIAFAALFVTGAHAQTTYKRTGNTHNNNTTARWEHDPGTVPAGGANWDQTVSPGSALNGPLDAGALDNIVLMPNGRPSGTTAQVTRLRTNAGTIGSLRIGGSDGGGGTGRVQLQLNANGSNLVVTGTTTIGFGGNREGRFEINGGTASAVLNDVVSGSTNGGNNIFLQGAAGASLTINGDIDSADTDGVHEIDLLPYRGNLVFGGAGAQTFHVDSFNIRNTGGNLGAGLYTVTIPAQKLIKTSNNVDDFLSRVANNNRTFNSTLNVGGTVNFGRDLQIGAAGTAGTNSTANATGNLVIDGGTVTIARELRLATITVGTQTAAGNVVVNSGSLDINNGIDIGTGGAGTRSGTITVNGGTVTHREAIDTHATASSTFELFGGTFNTQEPGGRNVGTIDWTGGTYQVAPGTLFSATDINLGAGGTLDLLTGGGSPGDIGGDTTWDGSAGTWTTGDGSTWNTGVAPDGAVAASGTITVLQSTNAITGLAPSGTGTWTPAISGGGTELEATTSAAVQGDPLRGVISSGTVTRSGDFTVAPDAGVDAGTLLVSGGVLNASDDDMTIGAGAAGTVTLNGSSATTLDNLYFADVGGTLNLDATASLTINGDIVEGAGGVVDTAVGNAQVYIDNANLTVTGDITAQSFRLGESSGTTGTYTIPSGQTLTNTGTFYVGNNGAGNLTIDAGGTLRAASWVQEEQNAGPGNSTIVVNGEFFAVGTGYIGRRDPGSVTVNTGGTMTHVGNVQFSGANDQANNGVLNVAGGTVTITGNVTKGTNNARDAFINVTSGGQLTLLGDLNFGNQNGLDVQDGRVDFLDPSTTVAERRVQNLTLNGANTPTLAYAITTAGTVQPLTVTNAPTVSAAGTILTLDPLGGSESPGGDAGNYDDSAVWIGGTGNWDAVAANWNAFDETGTATVPANILPANAADVMAAGGYEFALIDGPGAATLNIADFTSFSGDWDVTNPGGNADQIGLVNNTGIGVGPAEAVINDGSTVTRTSTLRVGLDANADASELTVIGTSTLDITGGTSDLIVGGAGDGIVNIGVLGGSAGTLTVAGDLLFGGPAGTEGGTVTLNAGSLTVTGDILEGDADGDITNVNGADLVVNGGTLSVAGTLIDVEDLTIGAADGSDGTWSTTTGQTVAISGRLGVGTGLDADVTGATGTFTVAAGSTVTANDFRVGQNGKATGILTVAGTVTTVSGGNVGGDDANTDLDDDTVGTINLTGSGSLTAGNAVQIGRSGDGFLNISDSAVLELTAGNLVFAQNQGGTADDDATATIVMTGGDLKVSGVNNDLNMNNGEVDYTQSGGTLTLAKNLNLVNDNVSDAQIIFSGTSVVNVAGYLDYRGGTSGDTITVQDTADINVTGKLDLDGGADDRFKIVGGTPTVDVGSIEADSGSTFEYEFAAGAVSGITVAATSTLNNAALVLAGTAPASGSFTLIDNATAASTGEFLGFPDDTAFVYDGKNFIIDYQGGGDGYDVVVTVVTASVVSITPLSGDVVEGTDMEFTISSVPGTGTFDVTLAYTGTATPGGVDYIEDLLVTVSSPSTTLTLPTEVDSLFEGSEDVTVTITGTTSGGIVGVPVAATSFLLDGPLPPAANAAINQLGSYAGPGTSGVDFDDIIAMDDTGAISSISNVVPGDLPQPGFHYTGLSNDTFFFSPLTNSTDDHSFSAAPGLVNVNGDGFAIDLSIKPTAADLAVDNKAHTIWEVGGATNGTGIYLIDGIPYLISSQGNNNSPSSLNDTDFGAEGAGFNNTICVPLSATALVANERVQIAVIYNLDTTAGTGTVRYSTNGAVEATHTLTNVPASVDWDGAPSVTIGAGGNGGMNGTGSDPFTTTTIALENAAMNGGGNAISSLRYWPQSDSTMTITTAPGSLLVDGSLTIRDWSSDAVTGTLSGTTTGSYASGAWTATGITLGALNDALADLVFNAGSAPPEPVVIDVSIKDNDVPQNEVTGAIVLSSTVADPIFVDDDFASGFAVSEANPDDGVSGEAAGLTGFNCFPSLAEAILAADPTATIIMNDGVYPSDSSLAGSQTLMLTGSGGSPGGSTVQIDSLNVGAGNTVDLGEEQLILGAPFTVDGGAVLTGSGSIDTTVTVDPGGILAPGSGGVGSISVGDLFLGGTLELDVNGNTTATHDQVLVTGTVDVNGATATITGTGSSAVAGDLVVIDNDGTGDSATGIPGGASGLIAGGSTGVIEAAALTPNLGDGNDVVLTLAEIAADDDTGDGDGLGALLELAFGTNYLVSDNVPLTTASGTTFTPGTQIMDVTTSPLRVYGQFVRRVGSSLTYTAQFNHDLNPATWEDSTAAPTVVVPDDGSGYEVVEVPFLLFLSNPPNTGRRAYFFRIFVNTEAGPELEPGAP